MISVHFQGKPFNITVIEAYAPTSNSEDAEVERFYEKDSDAERDWGQEEKGTTEDEMAG